MSDTEPQPPMRLDLASGPLDGLCFVIDAESRTVVIPLETGEFAKYRTTCEGFAEFDGYIDLSTRE